MDVQYVVPISYAQPDGSVLKPVKVGGTLEFIREENSMEFIATVFVEEVWDYEEIENMNGDPHAAPVPPRVVGYAVAIALGSKEVGLVAPCSLAFGEGKNAPYAKFHNAYAMMTALGSQMEGKRIPDKYLKELLDTRGLWAVGMRDTPPATVETGAGVSMETPDDRTLH